MDSREAVRCASDIILDDRNAFGDPFTAYDADHNRNNVVKSACDFEDDNR